MKKILLGLILCTTGLAHSSVCTDVLQEGMIAIGECRAGYMEHKCEEIWDSNDTLVALSTAHHLLKLGKVFTENPNLAPEFGENFVTKKATELRGEEIGKYLKLNHELYYPLIFSFRHEFWKVSSDGPVASRYNSNFFKKVVKFIDSNYQDYFMRYVRIINREVPWEEIQKMEKGLSMSELTTSLEQLNSNKCELLMKRYGLKISWKDVARETLDNHFQNLLKKAREEKRSK